MLEPVVACFMLEVYTAAPDMGCATSVHTPASPPITPDTYRPSETANVDVIPHRKENIRIKENTKYGESIYVNCQSESTLESLHETGIEFEDMHIIRSTDIIVNDKNDQEMDVNKSAIDEPKDKPVILESLVDRIIELHTTEQLLEEIKAENDLEQKAKEKEINNMNNNKLSHLVPEITTEVALSINKDTLNNNEKGKLEESDEEDSEDEPNDSLFSRSTRWEALADIAAELPASLTVDPLTGQIYALAK